MRKPTICIGENKDADQLRGNLKLISAFVFATKKVQSLFFLNLLGVFCDCTARFVSDLLNQRTNGPVNANLRPEIHTCTNKLVRLEWYNACI